MNDIDSIQKCGSFGHTALDTAHKKVSSICAQQKRVQLLGGISCAKRVAAVGEKLGARRRKTFIQ